VDDAPAAYRYFESLGFRCSETIEDPEQERLFAGWMHRKPSVHDVAFTFGTSPRLHHTGFFVPEQHYISALCDRLGATEHQHHIERGPGRHGVSNAFYVYLRDPDGHRIEIYTSDYFTGDPDEEPLRWSVHDMRRRDFWGAAVVPSWYSEATDVLDLDGKVVPLRAVDAATSEAAVGADGLR
jgi:catechol 2,3-dioxygenase-like lactoylglutathione lyase family enzyme